MTVGAVVNTRERGGAHLRVQLRSGARAQELPRGAQRRAQARLLLAQPQLRRHHGAQLLRHGGDRGAGVLILLQQIVKRLLRSSGQT